MKPTWKVICICLLLYAVCFGFIDSAHERFLPQPLGDSHTSVTEKTDYRWPVPASKTITSLFGNRSIALYGRERMHTGIDIIASTGEEVLAAQSGTVLVSVNDPGWGEYLIINHGNNVVSLYAHLNARAVERGETVEAGQVIGWVGNSGLSEAPHLHFELRKSGKSINPLQFTYSDQ